MTRRRNRKAAREQRRRHHRYAACEVCRAYCGPNHDPNSEHWCSEECVMAWYAAGYGLLTADEDDFITMAAFMMRWEPLFPDPEPQSCDTP